MGISEHTSKICLAFIVGFLLLNSFTCSRNALGKQWTMESTKKFGALFRYFRIYSKQQSAIKATNPTNRMHSHRASFDGKIQHQTIIRLFIGIDKFSKPTTEKKSTACNIESRCFIPLIQCGELKLVVHFFLRFKTILV